MKWGHKLSATTKPYRPSPVPQVDGAADTAQLEESSAVVNNVSREFLMTALERLSYKVDHMNDWMKENGVDDIFAHGL